MFVCKAFTSMVTKNEFSGILKILILFTKSFVPLIFGGISFTGSWKWWSRRVSEFCHKGKLQNKS